MESESPVQHPLPSDGSSQIESNNFDFAGISFSLPLSIALGFYFLSGDSNLKFLGALVAANLFYAKFK